MTTDAPLYPAGDCEHDVCPVDIGALARGLRPVASWAAVVLWWSIFVVLTIACIHPNGVTVSVVWVYVAVLVWKRRSRRSAFHRNMAGLPCLSRAAALDPPKEWPKVAVLVPARDEEDNVEVAARSVAALRYPNLDVWFVNDHSTDRTPRILDGVQRDYPNVHVLHDPPIVDGWFGKSNALWQAVLQLERTGDYDAAGPSPEGGPPHRLDNCGYLLFADADVVFEPEMLQHAVALAERDRLDFLTCMPRLIAKTWAEQFLLPTGWKGIVEGADCERLNDPRSFPIGIGAFMLVKYSSYRACGGHKALGQWHPEDTLLAAAVKHAGGRVGFAWTPDLMRVRFYEGYRQVKKNTLRKTRIFFGNQVQLPLAMMALRLSTTLMALPMIVAGVLPQLLAGRFDLVPALLAAAGIVVYVDEAREYKGVDRIAQFHPLVPWLHPISGALRVWFALSLAGQIIAKRPMEWRGRREFGRMNS
ncbi:MAG: glycosyltransferase [Candidatus Hydrogenedentes bacterium]|nr:glycosyltransferase [Candidatus Hydrogenedentota bacterium]